MYPILLFPELDMSTREVEDVLYRKSGLLGISGISNDMRALVDNDEPTADLRSLLVAGRPPRCGGQRNKWLTYHHP